MTLPDAGFSDRMDPNQRAQQQLERLQETLNRAYKMVPFYKNRFLEKNIDPATVETIDDLKRLPFTRRRDLAENYPYGLFAVPLRDIVRIHTAPGEGDAPSVSGFTAPDLVLWRRLVARALAALGMTANDVLQIYLDPGLANWGRGYKDAAEALEASVIPLTALSLEKQQMILTDYKTSVLVTTPSSATSLAKGLSDLNPNELALKTLVLVGDLVSESERDSLEQELNVSTWVHYGLSEVPGPAIAYECEAHDGLHISEDHFYPEIVDPETGTPVKPGQTGELVLTTLTTRAFPLIRFRTGDRVAFIEDDCPCGRTLQRISLLPDRTDDIKVIRGVKVHSDQVLAHVGRALGFKPGACRLLAGKKGGGAGLEVWLEMNDVLFSDEIKVLEGLVEKVENALAQELGITAKVRIKESLGEYREKHRWLV